MTADMDYRTEIVAHANSVKRLSATEENNLVDLVNLAIERFHDGWGQFFTEEEGRLTRAIEHIDRALAPMLVKIWTFHEDDDFWAFRTEEEAFAWLQGEGPNSDCPEPDGHFERLNNWKARSLWNVRQELDAELGDLIAWDKARWKQHWSRPPETTSRLPTDLQEMIFDFCQAWHDFVGPDLGLPRRDPNPSNPLLRFLDCCLKKALDEQRPAARTVLQLVHDHIRPAIRDDDEAKRREEEERARRPKVDLDELPPH